MNLNEIEYKVKKDWVVQFLTSNIDGFKYGVTLPITTLIGDWYNDCVLCPENGEFIHTVVFYIDGKSYPLIQREDITFEELMMELDKIA